MMAKHLQPVESTRRALRTALQTLSAVLAFALTVAIPPVADAANAVLAFVGVNYQITPGLVVAVGAFLSGVAALVAKLQNLLEGKDQILNAEAAAEYITALTDELSDLQARYDAVTAAARDSAG